MVVVPDRRGQGIGSLLVRAMAREAKALGFERLWFGTDGPGFYERLGAVKHLDKGRGFWIADAAAGLIRASVPAACPGRWRAWHRARPLPARRRSGAPPRRRRRSGASSSRSGSWPAHSTMVSHSISWPSRALLAVADDEALRRDALVVDAAQHLHLFHLQRGAVDPAGGLAQAAAGLAGLALQQRDLPHRRARLARLTRRAPPPDRVHAPFGQPLLQVQRR